MSVKGFSLCTGNQLFNMVVLRHNRHAKDHLYYLLMYQYSKEFKEIAFFWVLIGISFISLTFTRFPVLWIRICSSIFCTFLDVLSVLTAYFNTIFVQYVLNEIYKRDFKVLIPPSWGAGSAVISSILISHLQYDE